MERVFAPLVGPEVRDLSRNRPGLVQLLAVHLMGMVARGLNWWVGLLDGAEQSAKTETL